MNGCGGTLERTCERQLDGLTPNNPRCLQKSIHFCLSVKQRKVRRRLSCSSRKASPGPIQTRFQGFGGQFSRELKNIVTTWFSEADAPRPAQIRSLACFKKELTGGAFFILARCHARTPLQPIKGGVKTIALLKLSNTRSCDRKTQTSQGH